MKRAAITGSTGQIGSALAQLLLSKGVEVIAFCRPNSKRSHTLPQNHLLHKADCLLEHLDEFDVSTVPTCDVFFHMGWADTFEPSTRNDLIPQILNVKYSIGAVRLAKKMGSSAFVGAGSQAEYGRANIALRPDTSCHPETGYGIAKLCAGLMTRLECQMLGLRHVWPRMLSIYGPEDRAVAMIPSLISRCLANETPRMTKGEQLWDYLYSGDAAEALYLMGEKGRDGAVYPLGSGQARPLKEYVEIVCAITNPQIKPEFGIVPYSSGQIMHLCADITTLREDLGWEPKTNFENGIHNTINWLKNNTNRE